MEAEITKILGTDDWVPIKRFPVRQKGDVRPCDDGKSSGLNATTSRSEKLECSSIDAIVAMICEFRRLDVHDLQGWAIDESKAYRQIPVRPDHRRFGVVAVLDPAGLRGRHTQRVDASQWVRYFIGCLLYTSDAADE